MYKAAFLNLRWSYAAAAAMIVLVIITIIASYALRPLQPQQARPIERRRAGRGALTMSKPKPWQNFLRYVLDHHRGRSSRSSRSTG